MFNKAGSCSLKQTFSTGSNLVAGQNNFPRPTEQFVLFVELPLFVVATRVQR